MHRCNRRIIYAGIPIVFNGETYSIGTAEFFTEENGTKFEPYTGQDGITIHNRFQYYQNGEQEMHIDVQIAM